MSAAAVGRVIGLWRYPVKSMAGEALTTVDVGWHGLAGDRRWAFVQESLVRSGFPWLTIRERPDMWHFRPSFSNPDRPDASRTVVETPSGRSLEVVDPALGSELGGGVRVIKQNRGVFDTSPLSLITTRTIASLGAAAGASGELDPLRFRPNLLVEAFGDGADRFPEDAWVGAELTIGGLRMRADQRDERCVMINTDPVSAERDLPLLKTAGREHGACAGIYGTVVEPGRVAVGDDVQLAGERP